MQYSTIKGYLQRFPQKMRLRDDCTEFNSNFFIQILLVCLSVCFHPVNVKPAQPIGPTFLRLDEKFEIFSDIYYFWKFTKWNRKIREHFCLLKINGKLATRGNKQKLKLRQKIKFNKLFFIFLCHQNLILPIFYKMELWIPFDALMAAFNIS